MKVTKPARRTLRSRPRLIPFFAIMYTDASTATRTTIHFQAGVFIASPYFFSSFGSSAFLITEVSALLAISTFTLSAIFTVRVFSFTFVTMP